jgi:MoaA/NifB/PqqE/SkfB family radical SAM enzyme
MCLRHAAREWRAGEMSVDAFARLAPSLRQVETVVLQGWGEPLAHPHLVDIVALAKGRGDARLAREAPRVGFVTSGKGLDRRCAADLVAAGVDFVGFSFAGTTAATHSAIRVRSDFDELVAAVEAIHAIRREHDLAAPRTHLVYLMMKENVAELPDLPDLARRVGAEEIVLTNLIGVYERRRDDERVFRYGGEPEHEALVAEAERRARALGIAVRRAPLTPRLTPVCEENPLRNLFVTDEGDVSPCVYLCPPIPGDLTTRFGGREHRNPKVCFGNVLRQPIEEIWDGAEYRHFRQRFERRARQHRLGYMLGSQRGAPGLVALPDPPEPCRTCHKMLGL